MVWQAGFCALCKGAAWEHCSLAEIIIIHPRRYYEFYDLLADHNLQVGHKRAEAALEPESSTTGSSLPMLLVLYIGALHLSYRLTAS